MSRNPDSSATRHSLSSVQRQYIDSRIAEKTRDEFQEVYGEILSLNSEVARLRSALTTVAIRLRNIEDHIQDDKDQGKR